MKNRTQSPIQMPTYEPSGADLYIFWDEQVKPIVRDDETETVYSYAYAVSKCTASYSTLVVDIIRSQYSVDDEFAAINDGGERQQAFLTFRALAKSLARGWLDR